MEMENGKRIYVGRAQRKIERQGELRDKFEKLKEERLKRYQVSGWRACQCVLITSLRVVCMCLALSVRDGILSVAGYNSSGLRVVVV